MVGRETVFRHGWSPAMGKVHIAEHVCTAKEPSIIVRCEKRSLPDVCDGTDALRQKQL